MNELDIFISRMIHAGTTLILKILAGGKSLHVQLLWDHRTMGLEKETKMRIKIISSFFGQVSFHRASCIHRSMQPSPFLPSYQKRSRVGFRIDKERITVDFPGCITLLHAGSSGFT